jgi:YjbE family integral membrane protein
MPIEFQEFISNLLAIIIIDLVLAGDNAILIALATQKLPKAQQKKAILWGSLGAIVIRAGMTFIALWLLKIPGLLGVGGIALLWIAYRLLSQTDDHDSNSHEASTTFLGAMKTILIADAVMGVDNVLAVAGAAEGDFSLVVMGLLISIPIVIFGSQIVLKLLNQYPWLIYIGAGVLVITGTEMISEEPLIAHWFSAHHWRVMALHACGLLCVLGLGWKSRRS